jgi:hypothetical protein
LRSGRPVRFVHRLGDFPRVLPEFILDELHRLTFFKHRRELLLLAVPEDHDRHLIPRAALSYQGDEMRGILQRRPVEAVGDVIRLETGLVGRASRLDACYNDARLAGIRVLVPDAGRQIIETHAEIPAAALCSFIGLGVDDHVSFSRIILRKGPGSFRSACSSENGAENRGEKHSSVHIAGRCTRPLTSSSRLHGSSCPL